jgi:hypothetical protein
MMTCHKQCREELEAEVRRLENVVARLDQEIADLHSELIESRELENWFVDLHNNGNKVYVQEKNDGVLYEFRVKLPYRAWKHGG